MSSAVALDAQGYTSRCLQVLLWLPRMVLACASLGSGAAAGKKGQPSAGVHLLLYPRYHLDNSSLLGRHILQQVGLHCCEHCSTTYLMCVLFGCYHSLTADCTLMRGHEDGCISTSPDVVTREQAPLAMDVCGVHLVVASAPLDITVFRVDLTGALTPLGAPAATFTIVRQLSIMSPGQPLQACPAPLRPPPSICMSSGQHSCGSLINLPSPSSDGSQQAHGRLLACTAIRDSCSCVRCSMLGRT